MGLKNSLGTQAIFHYSFKSYISLEKSKYFLYFLNKTSLSLYISLTFNCYDLLRFFSQTLMYMVSREADYLYFHVDIGLNF